MDTMLNGYANLFGKMSPFFNVQGIHAYDSVNS